MKRYQPYTIYFLTEGKDSLAKCLELSFRRAKATGIKTVVIFTANGQGIELACTKYLANKEYEGVRVVGVSFPYGRVPSDALHISEDRLNLFERFAIPIVRSASPLDELPIPDRSSRNLVRRTLELFSGGTPLCIQAVLIACDAGLIQPGAHVITMSADTSLIVKASVSSKFFAMFAIREFICKPLIRDVSKGETLAAELNVDGFLRPKEVTGPPPQKQLPEKVEDESGE